MVFVLQNTQNRDGEALQAKLDELILVSKAENSFIEAERLSENELKALRQLVEQAREKAEARQRSRKLVTQNGRKN
jgi:low affinity Fe/Cu permease